jgi:hypothetical protein
MSQQKSDSIVPPHLAIKAMRDNGYKNAAFAIAELMDNSIQAGAKSVELICVEKNQLVNQRNLNRINEIAILDDGKGMTDSVLKIALQFGNGTRLNDPGDGIGKFGMGLPNSSISQAKHVDVYSWTDGVENALYSYIDIDEITSGKLTSVPEPVKKNVPKEWLDRAKFGDSGSLVIWSNLDRVSWTQGKTIIKNSELLIGRMYRYFLESGNVKISMKVFDGNTSSPIPFIDEKALPNDPLYLMEKTSCPNPFRDKSMFSKGDLEDVVFNILGHEVVVKYSYATKESREGINPGRLPHGKHAAKNVGVSIVRAGRELDLDLSWSDPSDPRDRWWGVEVDFPPALDEIFGVTNNKQHAHKFSELAKVDIDEFVEDLGYTSWHQAIEALKESYDERLLLLELAKSIRNNISTIRALLKSQTANSRPKSKESGRHATNSEQKGTEVTRQRQKDGNSGTSDQAETMSEKERSKDIVEGLVEDGMSEETAQEVAHLTISQKLKYQVVKHNGSGPAFFDVKPKGGALIISLNTNHPAYKNLVELIDEIPPEDVSEEELRLRLEKAKTGLELLIMAWARYEDELPDQKKDIAQDTRFDWGRVARDFLRE